MVASMADGILEDCPHGVAHIRGRPASDCAVCRAEIDRRWMSMRSGPPVELRMTDPTAAMEARAEDRCEERRRARAERLL